MNLEISDGSGKSYKAKVDKFLRLLSRSTTDILEAARSTEGDAFFANTTDTADSLTVTTTGGPILYIKNNSTTKRLRISKILPSTDQAATVLKIVRNPTLGTIGNNNTHVPVNANVGSNITADVTCYNWDEVGNGMTGLSGGSAMCTYILGVGFTPLPIDDTIIIQQGGAISFELNTVGSSAECSLGVRFYFEDE